MKDYRISVMRVGLYLLLMLLCCSSCSNEAQERPPSISVAMFNSVSFPKWRAYVEQKFPDIHIEWSNNRNSLESLLYQAKHNDLPDIVAIRRFETDTAQKLAPCLLDLSDTEEARQTSEKALRYFRFNGHLLWIPGPGVLEVFVANKTLFDSHGLKLPENWSELVSVCEKFEQQGIHPLVNDFGASWSATQLIEGCGMGDFFLTERGEGWTADFLSGKNMSFDIQGLIQAGARLNTLIERRILKKEDLFERNDDIYSEMTASRAAMGRFSTDRHIPASSRNDYVALPCFGENEADNVLFSYPIFSLALSRQLAQSPEKEKLARRVLAVMLSEEAQNILNEEGEGLFSYIPSIHLPLSRPLKSIEPYISQGRYIMRVLTSRTFAASVDTLHDMFESPHTPEEFSVLFRQYSMPENEDVSLGIRVPKTISNSIVDLVSPAASVLADALRVQSGADFACIDTREILSPIYSTMSLKPQEIDSLMLNSRLYMLYLHPKELEKLFTTLLYATTVFEYGDIEPLIRFPAFSGLAVRINRTPRVSELIPQDSPQLDPGKKYTLLISGNIFHAMEVMKVLPHMPATEYRSIHEVMKDYIASHDTLAKPFRYIVADWKNIHI